MVWAGVCLREGNIKILWDNNNTRNQTRQGHIRWNQEKQFAGCTPELFRPLFSRSIGSSSSQAICVVASAAAHVSSPTLRLCPQHTHTPPSWFPTCCRALWMSMPCPQGTAGLARQSPALPRREMSMRCRRRFWKASAITRTPSYVRADVYCKQKCPSGSLSRWLALMLFGFLPFLFLVYVPCILRTCICSSVAYEGLIFLVLFHSLSLGKKPNKFQVSKPQEVQCPCAILVLPANQIENNSSRYILWREHS